MFDLLVKDCLPSVRVKNLNDYICYLFSLNFNSQRVCKVIKMTT